MDSPPAWSSLISTVCALALSGGTGSILSPSTCHFCGTGLSNTAASSAPGTLSHAGWGSFVLFVVHDRLPAPYSTGCTLWVGGWHRLYLTLPHKGHHGGWFVRHDRANFHCLGYASIAQNGSPMVGVVAGVA